MKFLADSGLTKLIELIKKMVGDSIHPNTIIIDDTAGTICNPATGILNNGTFSNVKVNMDYDTYVAQNRYINSVCILSGNNHHHYSINYINNNVMNGFNCNYYASAEIKENIILRWNPSTKQWTATTRVTMLEQPRKVLQITTSTATLDVLFHNFVSVNVDTTITLTAPSLAPDRTLIALKNPTASPITITFAGLVVGGSVKYTLGANETRNIELCNDATGYWLM